MAGSQPKDQKSEAPSGASAPTSSAPNNPANNDISDSQTKITRWIPKQVDHMAAEAGDNNSAEDEQENMNKAPIATPSQQTESIHLFESNMHHTAAFTLSDEDGESAGPKPTGASDEEENSSPQSAKTTGSGFEFDLSSIFAPETDQTRPGGYMSLPSSPSATLPDVTATADPTVTPGDIEDDAVSFAAPMNPPSPTKVTQQAKIKQSKKTTDGKMRKTPPTNLVRDHKQQKSTKTTKKRKAKVIDLISEESSDDESVEAEDPWDNTDDSDDGEQMTDDEAHLPSSKGKTISWGKGSRGQLLMLGRRGDQEPLPPGVPALKENQSLKKKRKRLPEAVKEPFPANTITIKQPRTDFMEPYPARSTLPSGPITKVITAEEWDRRNAHWLDKLMDLESTKDKFGPIVEQEVTKEIFPLISKARRNILGRWAKSEDFELDWELLKAPIFSEVEVPDEVSQEIFKVETDAARRSLRAIETAALSLPKTQQGTTRLIKQHTDRLFAYRDQEIDNHSLMLEIVAKMREASSVTVAEMNNAFVMNESQHRRQVDPGRTERAKGLEALEKDMEQAIKVVDKDEPAERLIPFLKTHWRMRDGEIEDWKYMANSVCHTAKEAGHPLNTTDQDKWSNDDWDSLLRLARHRGGKALVALLNLERCNPDPTFLGRRDGWYKATLPDQQYEEWSDQFPFGEEPQSDEDDSESSEEESESDEE